MKFKRFNDKIVIRIEKGEELISSLTNFCKEQGIKGGVINSCIGATDRVKLGFYDSENKVYKYKEFTEDYELLTATGNITLVDNEPFPHIHVILGDENYQTYGGHLISAEINVTCEIYLSPLNGKIERYHDEDLKLNLMKLN